jgi:hypothetical protein
LVGGDVEGEVGSRSATAPALQEESGVSAGWSGAVMYSACLSRRRYASARCGHNGRWP